MHQTLASLLLPHLFDDALVGIALVAVILLFAGSVIVAIVASIKPTLAPGSANFTYVATVVAGLVLSVASGVLGEPAKAEVSASSGLTAPSSPQQQTVEIRIADAQIAAFRTLYAWSYVILGLVCLLVFIIPTPSTHDLIKGVALTTLGFLITLVGGVSHSNIKPPPPGQELRITVPTTKG